MYQPASHSQEGIVIHERVLPSDIEGESRSSSTDLVYSKRGSAPTVQPLRVVQPDAVCEVGGSTPDLSYGDLGISPGGGHPEKIVH